MTNPFRAFLFVGTTDLPTHMKVHEYQAKTILRDRGVSVPRGIACFSVDDALKAAQDLGGNRWVVKAQIHAGGRGKGGGVKVVGSIDEVNADPNQAFIDPV